MAFVAQPPLRFQSYTQSILDDLSFETFDYDHSDDYDAPETSEEKLDELLEIHPPGHIEIFERLMLWALEKADAIDYLHEGGFYAEAEEKWRQLLTIHAPPFYLHYQAAIYHLCWVLLKQGKFSEMKPIAWDLQKDLRLRFGDSNLLVVNATGLYIKAIVVQGRFCEARAKLEECREALQVLEMRGNRWCGENGEKLTRLSNEIFEEIQNPRPVPRFLCFELKQAAVSSGNTRVIPVIDVSLKFPAGQKAQLRELEELASGDLTKRRNNDRTSRNSRIYFAFQTRGLLLSMRERHDAAERNWREMFALQNQSWPNTPWVNVSNLSFALNEQKRYREAESVVLDEILHLEENLSRDSPVILAAWRQVIVARARQGRRREALLLYLLIERRIENMRPGNWKASKREEMAEMEKVATELAFGRHELDDRALYAHSKTQGALTAVQGSQTPTMRTPFPLPTGAEKTLLYELEKQFVETVYDKGEVPL